MSGLGEAATAAQALEKAKVAVVDIKFNRNTALLSQEDVPIATQLKGLYPDVATALPGMQDALRPAARSRICDRKPAEGSHRVGGADVAGRRLPRLEAERCALRAVTGGLPRCLEAFARQDGLDLCGLGRTGIAHPFNRTREGFFVAVGKRRCQRGQFGFGLGTRLHVLHASVSPSNCARS
jgi:hypothetical protein